MVNAKMQICLLMVLLVLSLRECKGDLVEAEPLVLPYHGGPLLTRGGGHSMDSLRVHLIWYGRFNAREKAIVRDFLASFKEGSSTVKSAPTVAAWWQVVRGYKDAAGSAVAAAGFELVGELSLKAAGSSRGLAPVLNASGMEALVRGAATDRRARALQAADVYAVLTGADVAVDGFCMHSCAGHAVLPDVGPTGSLEIGQMASMWRRQTLAVGPIYYAWVGNPKTQCPGQCAWPFALPDYMAGSGLAPAGGPPNGDIGMDGLVINLAAMLVGIATNPAGNGYFQGDPSLPLEAATACSGIFGKNAYPGYPGDLLALETKGKGKLSKIAFNVYGMKSRRFLLPALWNPTTQTCKPLP